MTWQDWFASTPIDRLQEAQSLNALTGGKPIMTQETAARTLESEYDIVDIEKEIDDLQKESEQDVKQQQALADAKRSENPLKE